MKRLSGKKSIADHSRHVMVCNISFKRLQKIAFRKEHKMYVVNIKNLANIEFSVSFISSSWFISLLSIFEAKQVDVYDIIGLPYHLSTSFDVIALFIHSYLDCKEQAGIQIH